MADQPKNILCFGDNYTFLTDRSLMPDESVDLIYLDPPFNSQQNYNVLFKETSGTPEAAQFKAFEDTWKWDMAANAALSQIHTDPAVPAPLVDLTKTFMNFLRPSPMMAYLVQMAIRLVHMHRVLKPTGSLYLHCDPTASHYLKIVLDAIFGPRAFRNEIVWKRTSSHNDSRRFAAIHDCIHYYVRGESPVWNPQHIGHDEAYLKSHYNRKDKDGRVYRLDNIIRSASMGPRPNLAYDYKGYTPKWGWRVIREKLQALDASNRLEWSSSGTPYLVRYLDEMKGAAMPTVWDDIPPINSQAAERLGYPTQKPLELLKRIVLASSNPGDVVLDPFCGCGTTIDAVETINRENPSQPPRRWIGIDITHISINLIKHRLTRFNPLPVYEVLGEPASVSAADHFAKSDPYQFQFWALGLVGARPVGGTKKKGADQGIDGVRYFQDEQKGGALVTKRMLVQVKGGHVKAGDIRDLVGTLSREGAEMGVFLTMEPPTGPMKSEAASAGMYVSPWDNKPYPKLQIVTIEELLKDPYLPNPRCLQVPGGVLGPSATLQEAPKHKGSTRQNKLFGAAEGGE